MGKTVNKDIVVLNHLILLINENLFFVGKKIKAGKSPFTRK